MTNTISKVNEELNETQKNLSKAADIAKAIPEKIKQLFEEKKQLKVKNEELQRTNNDLKNKVSNLEGSLSDQRKEFENKLSSNENRIVSLEREIELSKDEYSKLNKQMEEKIKRIEILESQNEEMTKSLREKSM